MKNSQLAELARQGFKDRNFEVVLRCVEEALSVQDVEYVHHPLGFLHTNIFSSGALNLRLHFWKKELMEGGSAITPYHDHIWRLSSCVLFGSIVNYKLEVRPDLQGDHTMEYVNQSSSVDAVETYGTQESFSVAEKEVVSAGEFYFLPPRVFHYSALDSFVSAITLVLSEVEVDGSPRTLMPIGSTPHAPKRQFVDDSKKVTYQILSILAGLA